MPIDDIEIHDGETAVELRKGQWAVLRDPKDVPEGKRRPLTEASRTADVAREEFAAARAAVLANEELVAAAKERGEEIAPLPIPVPSGDSLAIVNRINDLLVVALVDRWSFDAPITEESLLDVVPGADFDTLRLVTGPMFNDVMPNFGPSGAIKKDEATGKLVEDPESPTQP